MTYISYILTVNYVDGTTRRLECADYGPMQDNQKFVGFSAKPGEAPEVMINIDHIKDITIDGSKEKKIDNTKK